MVVSRTRYRTAVIFSRASRRFRQVSPVRTAERRVVLEIHLRARQQSAVEGALEQLAARTEGYSAAELEQVVKIPCLIGYPELKPHDLRHGVAVEVLKQRHDLEELRALLGHARIDTTQIYTKIRPPQLKRAVAFYEDEAERPLSVEVVPAAPRVSGTVEPGSRNIRMFLESGSQFVHSHHPPNLMAGPRTGRPGRAGPATGAPRGARPR